MPLYLSQPQTLSNLKLLRNCGTIWPQFRRLRLGMIMALVFCLGTLGLLGPGLHALEPSALGAADLALGLRRLGTVGTVLYVAAHPDDENTRLIAYLTGQRGLRTVYLSLTRGDGGQNLIGAEQDELLGLLRTHELLAARRIDGAEQAFTRARDFGYSKSAQETLKIWNEHEVLQDVIRTMRRVRPDVVMLRFTPKPPNHGHHMASAILGERAFGLAGDASLALTQTTPWQPQRLLLNVPVFNRKLEDVHAEYRLDVGGYEPLLGRSWGEVAASSRSQHKSQGFGVAAARGPLPELFDWIAGSKPKDLDPLADMDFSWRRFAGGAAIQTAIDQAAAALAPQRPEASLPALAHIHALIAQLPATNPYRADKLAATEALMVACAGLYLDATTDVPELVPGAKAHVILHALLRRPVAAQIRAVTMHGAQVSRWPAPIELAEHASKTIEIDAQLPADALPTTPYWLQASQQGALYQVGEPQLIGQPVAEPPLTVDFSLRLQGIDIAITRALTHSWADPVQGERSRQVEVAPPLTLTPDRPVAVTPLGHGTVVTWTVQAHRSNVQATIAFSCPPGWQVSPLTQAVQLQALGDQTTVAVTLTPPAHAKDVGWLRAHTQVDGRDYAVRQDDIDYPHVPPLTVRRASEVRLVPLDLQIGSPKIGYVPGPGDRVADLLAAVGYEVTLLPLARLAQENLSHYNAIIVGVRAYNAQPKLAAQHERLMQYVAQGGHLVVQYQTNSRIGPLTVPIGPYPLEIGNDRVTDEEAPLLPLLPQDAALTTPNLLTEGDFHGWVQERGLYFAKNWDPRYTPLFASQDDGEKPLQGAVLLGKHGKGIFVYTGLSFFRQLPAGVPGAYRLLANLLQR